MSFTHAVQLKYRINYWK